MNIAALLSPECIAREPEVSSKKRAFERLAGMLASCQENLEVESVLEALNNREKLGSTALGNGISIPHASLPIQHPCGALLLLDEGVKMDAPDKKPVQLFMALLVPASHVPDYSPLITDLTVVLSHKSLVEQVLELQDIPAVFAYLETLFASPSGYGDTNLAA
jgi:PTS system nitrogen regulatory IIA component